MPHPEKLHREIQKLFQTFNFPICVTPHIHIKYISPLALACVPYEVMEKRKGCETLLGRPTDQNDTFALCSA